MPTGGLGDWGTGGILRRFFSPSPRLLVSQSLLIALLIAAPMAGADAKKTVKISDELRVLIEEDEGVFLSARPLPGEALDAFVKRFSDDPATKKEILTGNGGMNL